MEPSQIKVWIEQLSPDEQELLKRAQGLADEMGPHLILEQVYLAMDLLCETLQALMPKIACPTGCSRCCNTPPLLTTEEAKLIQEMYPDLKYIEQEGTCGFLKKGQCQIYSARPLDCRAKGYFFEQVESALPMFQQGPQPWTCAEESQRWKAEIQSLENPVKYMFLPMLNPYRQLVDGPRKPPGHYFSNP